MKKLFKVKRRTMKKVGREATKVLSMLFFGLSIGIMLAVGFDIMCLILAIECVVLYALNAYEEHQAYEFGWDEYDEEEC